MANPADTEVLRIPSHSVGGSIVCDSSAYRWNISCSPPSKLLILHMRVGDGGIWDRRVSGA